MNWGMISYEIPLKLYPQTYKRMPLLPFARRRENNYALYPG